MVFGLIVRLVDLIGWAVDEALDVVFGEDE